MTNIREIARRAGVGIATVSRYINNTGYVSEEVGVRIRKEIETVGYTPNALAKAIFSKSSKTIGLMIPNIINPFFNQMATVIEDHASKFGYTLFLCNTEDDKEKELRHLEVLKSHRVDGIIASRSMCKEEYVNIKIPVISFENHISPHIHTISSDNYAGGRIAFNHLYERGCRNILHIKGPSIFEATEARYRGFLDEAEEKSLHIDVATLNSDFQVNMLEEGLNSIENIEKHDGIFIFNDIAAAAVMKYLNGKGLRVPDDIQIIGFDNSFICKLVQPSLTTIEQPIEELGSLAVKLLMDLIEGKELIFEERLLKTKLIQRGTTLDNSFSNQEERGEQI